MARFSLRLIPALVFASSLTLPSTAQNSAPQSQTQPAQVQPQPTGNHAPQNPAAQPALTLRTFTRMVTLEVVAEDSKGRHITGLNADDFKISEQTPKKSSEKREQKIAAIREVQTAALEPPAALPANAASGVYTNAVGAQTDAVPPTVIVVDGINTPIQAQAQVHEQMLKILRQLPPNVPVAVMLMGDRLELLQGFTTDPKLLQQALAKAHSVVGQGLQNDPRWDPDSPMNLAYGLQADTTSYSASLVDKVGSFDVGIYAFASPLLLRMTCDAFMSIAHSLEGYPGRKNLLWLSTSFPLTDYLAWSPGKSAHPNIDDNLGIPNYIQILDNALSDARIAIYPVDLGGVTTLQAFTAQTRIRAQSGIEGTMGG